MVRGLGYPNPLTPHGPVLLAAVTVDLGILKKMLDANGVERRSPADHSMNLVALFQELFGQIRSVLPSNSGDESFLVQS